MLIEAISKLHDIVIQAVVSVLSNWSGRVFIDHSRHYSHRLSKPATESGVLDGLSQLCAQPCSLQLQKLL